jgi:hypothetical protein
MLGSESLEQYRRMTSADRFRVTLRMIEEDLDIFSAAHPSRLTGGLN